MNQGQFSIPLDGTWWLVIVHLSQHVSHTNQYQLKVTTDMNEKGIAVLREVLWQRFQFWNVINRSDIYVTIDRNVPIPTDLATYANHIDVLQHKLRDQQDDYIDSSTWKTFQNLMRELHDLLDDYLIIHL
jgi:hypothetical protein